MGKWTYVCLVIGLFLLAAPAGAQIPDTIAALDVSADWVTAGSSETSTVTALVTNNSNPLSGVAVAFTVDNSDGTVSPVKAVTDSYGTATAVFKPGIRSGTATITATVSHEKLAEPLTKGVGQKVDHAAPHVVANLWYDSEVTAGETAEIVIRLHDKYGNPVDDRRTAETAFFMVGSPAGGTAATFVGGTDEIVAPVDATGNVTVTLRAGTVAGENIIYIRPPSPIKVDSIIITGMGGTPSGVTLAVTPDAGWVPANSKDKITLRYTLVDEYGNPTGSQGLWVNASGLGGQSRLIYTNSIGEAWATYGPEDTVGIAAITATALANQSVTITIQLEFTSTEPVKMVVSASPQTMASRDLKDDVVSELRARVMDIKGNPVDGEDVTFTIDTGSINVGGSNATGDPYLGEVEGQTVATAVTSDGSAIVRFHPGSFAKPEAGEAASAKGNVTVWATWGDVSRPIELTWVNYPYLSVETEVSNDKVSVNSTDEHTTNTTYVTIRVKGDGYAMQPDPIDVVLVIDRSGSMDTKDAGETKKRMALAKDAASTFIGEMDSDRDRVGLVSFASDTTKEADLTNNFGTVKGKVTSLSANGATQLRRGIYEAIRMQKNQEQTDAIRAVVVMTDGDWNYDGSPIGHGTGYPETSSWAYTFSGNTLEPDNYRYYEGLGGTLLGGTKKDGRKDRNYEYCLDGESTNQNMSNFAIDNDVKLYMITFAFNPSTTVQNTMRTLATSTGGFYEHAPSGAKLEEIYKRIAGELKNEASVDTNMTVFENVEVDGMPIAAYTVFDYRYELGKSTTIHGWVDNKTGHYPDIPAFKTINQTDAWKQDKQLHFDIGTIHLGQTWETTFCLAVNASYRAGEENNINIFGPGAVISFNNGTANLELPDTYVTVFPDLNNTGITSAWLEVFLDEPDPDHDKVFTDTVPLTWTTTYNGTYTIDETLAYSNSNKRMWTAFWTKPGATAGPGSALMDVRGLPAGEYWIRLTASAPDAPEAADEIIAPIYIKSKSQAYIKIE